MTEPMEVVDEPMGFTHNRSLRIFQMMDDRPVCVTITLREAQTIMPFAFPAGIDQIFAFEFFAGKLQLIALILMTACIVSKGC